MELDLTKLREEINKTDKELLDLFKRRMEIAAGVAEYKRENGLPVLDAARERALLDRISDMAGDEFDGYARTLWRTMMDVSKAYQYTRTVNASSLFDVHKPLLAHIENKVVIFMPVLYNKLKVIYRSFFDNYSLHK